jgi:membrane protein implicated in regulation of membrane protease activity
MYVVIIAWGYVVLLMAVAEAISSQGTVLGAFFTLLLYGVLPLSIVVYILGTPGRKRARAAREAQEAMASADDDAGSQAAVGTAGPVAAKREEA